MGKGQYCSFKRWRRLSSLLSRESSRLFFSFPGDSLPSAATNESVANSEDYLWSSGQEKPR